jgi:hypothetical protein
MKQQIIKTAQGIIVKIDCTLIHFDRAFRRAEKKVGSLHLIGYDGDYSIFCDTYHERHETSYSREYTPTTNARAIQSRAMKKLHTLGRIHGFVSITGAPEKNLVAKLAQQGVRMAPVMLRYAYGPMDYTAPETVRHLP